jgi:hypothetical protein
MISPDLKNKVNEQLNVCHYAVAYFDLLGQTEALLQWDKLLDEEVKYEERRKIMQNTIGVFKFFHNSVLNFFKGLYQDNNVKNNQSYLDFYHIKIQRFSDGFMIFTPAYIKKENMIPIDNIYNIILASSLIMFLSLVGGKPIRGSFVIGLGVECYADELYGPVIGKAYKLESTIAQHPRIVVDNSLIKYLEYCSHEIGQIAAKPRIKYKNLIIDITKMIYLDKDGHFILDYLGKSFKRIGNDAGLNMQYLYNKAMFFIKDQIKFHQEKNDNKLTIRYMTLQEYFIQKNSMS